MTFHIERKDQPDKTGVMPGVRALFAPAIEEGYWSHRVGLSEAQALVAFPKFGTIGIGFAVEEDWNTNLPWSVDPGRLLVHICHNRGDDSISYERVYDAIVALQAAIAEDHGTTWQAEHEQVPRFADEAMDKHEAVAAAIVKMIEYRAEAEDEEE